MADIPDSPDISQLPAFTQNPLQGLAAQSMNQPIAPPTQPQSRLKQILQSGLSSMGAAMMKDAGLETPDEKQQRIIENRQKQQQLNNQFEQIQSLAQLRQFQQQQTQQAGFTADEDTSRALGIPVGTRLTTKDLLNYLGKKTTSENALAGKVTAAQIAADANKAKQLQTGATITPELAQQYGLPDDFIGKVLKVSDVSRREQLPIQKARLAIAAGNLSLRQKAFERDTFGTLFGKDIPSSLVDEKGNTIGWKSPSSPTANIKTQAQQSQDLVKLFDVVRNKIDDLDKKGQLGPLAGRLYDVMTGKIGLDNPDFAEFRMLGSLISSGTLKAHFGARGGGLKIYEDFERQMGPQMTPGNLRGVLTGMSAFMGQYATRARTAGDRDAAAPKSNEADFDFVPGKGLVRR